jgi:hypothetical protein
MPLPPGSSGATGLGTDPSHPAVTGTASAPGAGALAGLPGLLVAALGPPDTPAAEDDTDLPLHERRLAPLHRRNRQPGTKYHDGLGLSSSAAMTHLLLRRSLDSISERRGLQLTTDTVHLNSCGANMAADLIEEFLTTTQTST